MYIVAVQYNQKGGLVDRSFYVKYTEAESYSRAMIYAKIARNTYSDVRIVEQGEWAKERKKVAEQRKIEAQKARQEKEAALAV